ncbi:YlbF family regulator [Geosporobacter ferrireducens]|uniref:UPF0342 protein Gferi_26900 n=1 Tax=Geosporobacter ferrireducens TaxID=1424294 RepID=A0A1D8GPN0_9FIRM|nr:YlbF family regulator [Geosporobacter ferrireducens]AOT72865.1 hypothetical protein Gferi_26900 [Geosporobacter ferrireducens]MTI55270.1 YlbF family regulator [Geosporobacter ferrireducens]
MNIHDYAHQLAKALKNSDEFRQYKRLQAEVQKTPQLKQMIDDFHKRQIELQAAQLSGQTLDQSKTEQIQKLYEVIAKDPMAAEFLHAEIRFSQLIGDVYKIIGEAVDMKDMFS